jgi:hypothetical protein
MLVPSSSPSARGLGPKVLRLWRWARNPYERRSLSSEPLDWKGGLYRQGLSIRPSFLRSYGLHWISTDRKDPVAQTFVEGHPARSSDTSPSTNFTLEGAAPARTPDYESGGQEFESLRARQLSYWCCYRTQAVRSASTCVAHYREAPARESHPYLGGARPGVFFTTSALVCTIPNEDLNIFADWLTAIVIANQARQANYPLTAIEARRALRQAGVRVFPSVGHRLAVEMHSAKPAEKISKWREVVGPVFQSIWPLDIELQTPVSTFKLVQILRATGNAFPEAADVVIPFIRPEDPRRHTSVHSISEADEALYTSAPQKMLHLLAAIVGDAPAKSVYGLNKVLDRIVAVDSQLADTKKFQKLVSKASIH